MILDTVIQCMEQVKNKFSVSSSTKFQLKGIGVTNQRETTIVWDKYTGLPLHNAIVWLDTRTSEICSKIIASHANDKDCFRDKVGLPISTYFSAVKLLWLIENVTKVKEAIDQKRCLFGTIDSWIIWNLTGGENGGKHVTDVTNASRTLLFNLKSLDWDISICKELAIDPILLPSIKSSAEIYGYIPASSSNFSQDPSTNNQKWRRFADLFPEVPVCGVSF